MTEQSNGGRFAKGTSGNRRGRPKSANRRLEKQRQYLMQRGQGYAGGAEADR